MNLRVGRSLNQSHNLGESPKSFGAEYELLHSKNHFIVVSNIYPKENNLNKIYNYETIAPKVNRSSAVKCASMV